MRRLLITCTCLLWVCSLAAPVAAADAAPGDVEYLTQVRSDLPPVDVAKNYLQAARADLGLTPADLEGLYVKNLVPSTHGMTHIYYRQKLGGLEVANAVSNINIAGDGRVMSLGNRFVTDLASKVNTFTPELDARQAILAAAESLDLRLDSLLEPTRVDLGSPTRQSIWTGAGISTEPIPATLTLYRVSDDEVRLAWDLVIAEAGSSNLWNLFVDAVTGETLGQYNWTHNEGTYEVFALPLEHPNDGARTLEMGMEDPVASPFGWHDTDGVAGAEFTDTRGNNVFAQEDRDADNSAGFRPDGGINLEFLFALDLTTQQPVDYQSAAITNLFYWNNIMHDILFHYGFDEAAGNFQEINYSGDPDDADAVLADAQDGSGTNNANFSTPPEGGPFDAHPRMQMFEWTPSADSIVRIDSPTGIAGDYTASAATFGPALSSTGISGTIEATNPADGCTALSGFTTGNIAIIDRGTCEFGTKVLNAENAGAIAAIVVNNQGDGLISMGPGAEGDQVTISSVFVGQTDGTTIKSGLPGATGTLLPAGDSILNRDSDFDNGVIAHEYGHGLSIRLTGGSGTSNCLSGDQQAGEGWSDWLALWVTAASTDTPTTSRGIGTYVTFQPVDGPGIRRFPYTTDTSVNPDTYETIGTGISVPHGVGSVWAAILWEVYWELVNTHGFDTDFYNGTGGNNLAMQLMVDGLQLQPCDPTFVDARDAIILADQNLTGGANRCRLWKAFAKRGLGVSADDGGGANSLAVTNGFDIPTDCAQTCGNNVIEGTEVCDGTDLGGQTCGDFGCTGGGTLACNSTCDGFDTSGCLDCPACDFDGVCELGEDCNGCPSDCVSGTSSGAVCGNGVCEAGNGEDCVTCALDCNGVQNGNPNNRFCCGAGGGDSPVDCSDPRCSEGGVTCTNDPVSGGSFCCGDGFCDAGEGCGTCGLDCATGAEICDDGVDNDCNGDIDCNDVACVGDPICDTTGGGGAPGDPCTSDSECQSGKCKGNGTCR